MVELLVVLKSDIAVKQLNLIEKTLPLIRKLSLKIIC